MISALLLINSKAEILLSHFFRTDIGKEAIDGFRMEVIQGKNAGVPVINIGNISFMYTREGEIFFVAVTKMNANPALVFTYMNRMIEVFKAFFNNAFDEGAIRENLTTIFELFDETMDDGYPQVTAINVLAGYIQSGKATVDVDKLHAGPAAMTSAITGAVDWRQPGKHNYSKNEVYLDVLEAVNLMMSSNGTVLRGDVSGKIQMKTFLSGMPECKFGLNDKLVLEKDKKVAAVADKKASGISIDDLTFHRCVKLNQFDTDRTISFVPPDGEFELMKYRVTQNVNLPFKVIPVVSEIGRTRVEYDIKVRANFESTLQGSDVVIKIPTPKNTATANVNVSSGKAKYFPEQSMLVWKIKSFPGGGSFQLRGEVKLAATINDDKAWSRPPIEMEFQVPMFAASSLQVRFLKVFERTNYPVKKMIRYITRAGTYQIRM